MTYLMVENRRLFNCLMDWSVIVCCVFVPVGFFDCGSFDFMRQAGNSNISCTVLLLEERFRSLNKDCPSSCLRSTESVLRVASFERRSMMPVQSVVLASNGKWTYVRLIDSFESVMSAQSCRFLSPNLDSFLIFELFAMLV
jgi:hypothetical protein